MKLDELEKECFDERLKKDGELEGFFKSLQPFSRWFGGLQASAYGH